MKKSFLIILALVFAAGIYGCRKKGEASAEAKLETALLKDTTQIQFLDSTTFPFDTITEGDKVEHTFRMKNVGNKNLIIAHAYGSCGCTVPQYPKDPVKPGDIASIQVTFNSTGKHDQQNKSVTIVCNTGQHNEMVFLTGFVKAKN